MDQKVLKDLQKVELSILRDIDSFCKKNNINYSLYGGTKLGAIRHGGFVPWDDDIDICMERAEYNRFVTAWKANPIDG